MNNTNETQTGEFQQIENNSNIDYIYFFRSKKSFRYLIFSIILLTFCLWFSDRYLRFDLDETKYRVALTLEKESARPILRNIEKKILSNPSFLDDPRYIEYLEFLALIEEDDAVLKIYQDIYNNSNINMSFLINYAVKLYFMGDYNKARDIIREAQSLSTNNSLTGYLESSFIINPNINSESIFNEGVSIIAKENRSEKPIIFPEPFWHNTLPKFTYAYYVHKNNILNHCLAPLYRMTADILKRVETDLAENNFHNKEIWLEEISSMGKRIGSGINMKDFYSNLPICIFSLKIQKDTLSLYKKFIDKLHSPSLDKEIEKLNRIEKFLAMAEKLEERRKLEFDHNREKRLKEIVFITSIIGGLIVIYLISKALNSVINKFQNITLVLKFHNFVYIFIFIWALSIFLSLSSLTNLFNTSLYNYTGIILWLLYIIFPFFTILFLYIFNIPTFKILAYSQSEHGLLTDVNVEKKKLSFRFIPLFFEKLSGVASGNIITVTCFVFLIYRIIYLSYPFQLNLIWDTTRMDEYNLLNKFLLFILS